MNGNSEKAQIMLTRGRLAAGLRAGTARHRRESDCVGTDEAVAVSLALSDRARIVTIAAFTAAQQHGFTAIAGNMLASAAYRDGIRGHLIDLAGRASSWCQSREPTHSQTRSKLLNCCARIIRAASSC